MKLRLLALPLSASCLTAVAIWSAHAPAHGRHRAESVDFKKLPLGFAAVGTPDRPEYLAQGPGYSLELAPGGAALQLRRGADAAGGRATIRTRLLGAGAGAVAAEAPLPGTGNYFIGQDRSRWRTGVTQYERVRYSGVYPGVDLVYYGNQQQLEYDFVLAPGADAGRIRMAYSGAERLEVNGQGDLVLHSGGGELVQHQPVAYQTVDGRRRAVAARYRLDGETRQVSFVLGAYDRRLPLTIDPVLSYSSYLGSGDAASGIALDAAGNLYVTGSTGGSFPVTSGAEQTAPGGGTENAFVAKLNPAGTALVYATYLGGSGYALANGIAVDSSGNAYVTGFANGAFPTTAGALQTTYAGGASDAFVSKLSASGTTLLYSTYLGGVSDSAAAIAVSAAGNAYIAGAVSAGGSIPASSGAAQPAYGGGNDDAFIAELNAGGSAVVYASYLGGAGNDNANAIALDASGNAYVAGTTSGSFPTSAKAAQPGFGGGTDAFVAEFNTAAGGALLYSTYLGGSGIDGANAVAADVSGNAYVGGYTSGAFPLVSPFQPAYGGGNDDGFVAKVAAGGGAVAYASYLGGSGVEEVNAIAVDAKGYVYAAGDTSGNFPVVNAVQSGYGGGSDDGFVTVVNPAGGAVLSSTYLGGAGDDSANAIAADGSGDVYVAGITTGGFPTSTGAFQTSLNGANGAFVAEISGAASSSSSSSSSSSGGSSSSSSGGGSGGGGGGGSPSPVLLIVLAGFAAWRRRRAG